MGGNVRAFTGSFNGVSLSNEIELHSLFRVTESDNTVEIFLATLDIRQRDEIA